TGSSRYVLPLYLTSIVKQAIYAGGETSAVNQADVPRAGLAGTPILSRCRPPRHPMSFLEIHMKRIICLFATCAISASCGGAGNVAVVVDVLAPTVLSTGPASAATGVPRNPAVTVTFSEAMSAS